MTANIRLSMSQPRAEVAHEQDLAQHIRDILSSLMQDFNDQHFAAMTSRMASSVEFSSSFDGQIAVDLNERNASHLKALRQYPQFRVEVTEPAVVNLQARDRGFIRAYLSFNITGAPPGVIIPSVNTFDFQEHEGTWLISKISGMRIGAQF